MGPRYISEVETEKTEIVAVCHPDYRGVKSATREIVTDIIGISEIPNIYHARKLAQKICSYNPKKVIISGYSVGYDLLAQEISTLQPGVRIFFYIHSSFTWFDNYPAENATFDRILKLNKAGVVEKIGFCKRDLSDYFSRLGYTTFFVMNRFSLEEHKATKSDFTHLKIGIWGNNWWHRNILNQVIASLMISGVEVHVNELKDVGFLDSSRIVKHGFLPKPEFLKVFSEMDINLYVSFTDCFPMTLVESMQYGIPAIASDTSEVYSFSPKLKEMLTVSSIDSPIGISKKISEVIADYDNIQSEIVRYLPVLNKKVEQSIKEFLS
jgi:glycosyltransferase involved in cell wall biosynthesis